MSNQQDCPALALPDLLRPELQFSPGQGIKCAEWLVEQQDVPLLGDGPCQRDALAHSTRELMRVQFRELLQAEVFKQPGSSLLSFRAPNPTCHLKSKRHICDNGPPRKQRILLGHPRSALQIFGR